MQSIFCLSLPHTPNKTIENDYIYKCIINIIIILTIYTNFVDLFVVNVNYYFLTRKLWWLSFSYTQSKAIYNEHCHNDIK